MHHPTTHLGPHPPSVTYIRIIHMNSPIFAPSLNSPAQEAQKRLLVRRGQAPTCLILHLKRFKYVESQGR